MNRAARDIDDGQAGARAETGAEQPARLAPLEGQAARFGNIVSGGGDTAIGGAGADRDHIARGPRHRRDNLRHRGFATGEDMEPARAVRPP